MTNTATRRDEKLANPIRYNRHPNRKNNDIVAAMYAMYQCGQDGKPKSLSEVGAVYRKTRQAVYDVFRTRGYKLRSKQKKNLTIVDGIEFTEMKGGYLRGTTPKGRMTLHKYLWENKFGPIPNDSVLHHIDGDPKNNRFANLQLVRKSDMYKVFNPERRTNPKLSWETRKKEAGWRFVNS